MPKNPQNPRRPRRTAVSGAYIEPEDFRLRDIAVAAYGPSVLFGLAEGAMLPVITISAIDRGASVATAAFIAALIGIGSIVTNIPAGQLASRVGERLSMVAAAAVSCLGLLLCILPFGLWAFGLGVFLLGCAASVFNLARQSYLTERAPAQFRARALSTLGGSMRIGVFIGPFLGAAVMHFVGLNGAYLVSLAATIGAGALAYMVPDLDNREADRAAAAAVTSAGMFREHWRVFMTLGIAIMLLSAIRQSRQIVIPLWAHHIGLDETATSMIFGIAGAIDALMFYPAGKVMDRFGRKSVAVPSMTLMGLSFILMPLTHGFSTLALVALLMGFANGIGSGIVMTMGADVSPAVGRPTFLGIWREYADIGTGLGPVLLSFITGVVSLAAGMSTVGVIGFAAAGALFVWAPKRQPRQSREIIEDSPKPNS